MPLRVILIIAESNCGLISAKTNRVLILKSHLLELLLLILSSKMLSFEPAKSGRYSVGQTNRVLVLTLAEEDLTFYKTKKVGEFTCRKNIIICLKLTSRIHSKQTLKLHRDMVNSNSSP